MRQDPGARSPFFSAHFAESGPFRRSANRDPKKPGFFSVGARFFFASDFPRFASAAVCEPGKSPRLRSGRVRAVRTLERRGDGTVSGFPDWSRARKVPDCLPIRQRHASETSDWSKFFDIFRFSTICRSDWSRV